LKLQRDTKNLTFKIEMPCREPFALHEMSDGYAAFLKIVMELLMRLESDEAIVDYEKSAIVMIDEIETHMHVELQRRVLPFLTKMFPNIQFIVATHSPFVIASLNNAVVYDLEKFETLENPWMYSTETIVESFLDTSTYSKTLAVYFARYKELCFRERTAEENEEFLRAKTELELMAPASKELYIAFRALEAERKAAKNG
jgi:predicted ATP-binding protein involved in virulence